MPLKPKTFEKTVGQGLELLMSPKRNIIYSDFPMKHLSDLLLIIIIIMINIMSSYSPTTVPDLPRGDKDRQGRSFCYRQVNYNI